MRTNQTGMTAARCPVTNTLMPNVSSSFGNFHISYCYSSADYGCPTTAIVLAGRVFFILDGNHAEALCAAAEIGGAQACISYFISHISHANSLSEHRMATGLDNDPFALAGTALEVLGADTISTLRLASCNRPATCAPTL